MENFIPGAIQGITRVVIAYPFDVIKINMQKNNFRSSYECVCHIFKNDYKQFYRGSQISFISVPFDRSIQYYLMEKYKNKYNVYLIGLCYWFNFMYI